MVMYRLHVNCDALLMLKKVTERKRSKENGRGRKKQHIANYRSLNFEFNSNFEIPTQIFVKSRLIFQDRSGQPTFKFYM